MATKFSMTRDINGYNGFGVKFSDINYQTTLVMNVAQSLTIPSSISMGGASDSRWLAVFSYNPSAIVWVADGATATLPGPAFTSTASQLNPAAREVKGGDVLSFVTSDATANLGVSLYAL